MIHYITHNDIDREKWDRCIIQSYNGLIYALSWYLDIVAGEWSALVEDDYKTVFPLFPKKKYGISYCIQPAWTQQLGIFSSEKMTPEKNLEFLSEATKRFRWFEINMNAHLQIPISDEFLYRENNNYVLPLIYPYEQIFAGYSNNLKRNLKKINNNNNFTVIPAISHEELVNIFKTHRGQSIPVLNEKHYINFIRLIYYARSKGMAQTYGIADETNTLLGGMIILYFNNRATMIFSAIVPEGRNKNAMHALIDHYIQNHCGTDTLFDFEGSNNENLAQFYKSFGAQNSPYLTIICNKLPLSYRFIQYVQNFMRIYL